MSCSLLADGHSQRHVFVDVELSYVGKVAIGNGLSFYDVGFEELGLGAVFACRTSGQRRKRDHESRKPKHWWHLTSTSTGARRQAFAKHSARARVRVGRAVRAHDACYLWAHDAGALNDCRVRKPTHRPTGTANH